MKLDNKFFPAFMAVVAVLTALAIVYSSLSYTETQKTRFEEAIKEDQTLLTRSFSYVDKTDSLKISDFGGKDVVVVFWASWSEKSDLLFNELLVLKDETDSLEIIGALVLDATETIEEEMFYEQFKYIDGAKLYNDLKVPGIPSYIVFNKSGIVEYVHVGYQEGSGYSLLKEKLNY